MCVCVRMRVCLVDEQKEKQHAWIKLGFVMVKWGLSGFSFGTGACVLRNQGKNISKKKKKTIHLNQI